MFVDGTIAEHGNHKALRAKRGHYHRMMARMESLITGPDGQPTITPRCKLAARYLKVHERTLGNSSEIERRTQRDEYLLTNTRRVWQCP